MPGPLGGLAICEVSPLTLQLLRSTPTRFVLVSWVSLALLQLLFMLLRHGGVLGYVAWVPALFALAMFILPVIQLSVVWRHEDLSLNAKFVNSVLALGLFFAYLYSLGLFLMV